MLEQLKDCKACPFKCRVNRLAGQIGKCRCNDKIKIDLYSLHHFEEPCISGKNGSGSIFFSFIVKNFNKSMSVRSIYTTGN